MPKHQYSLALIQHQMNNAVIAQRESDGYINATDLCKAAGKRWYNYVRNENTGHFLRALEAKTQIRASELIQEVNVAGVASTWVHPKVAIHLAQSKFGVQYFKSKDPNSLAYVDKLPALAAPKRKQPLRPPAQ